jgi:heme/copper-type cytochrome/quinol oxidase subunit 2
MAKLNFWQWLGVVLLVIGVTWWIVREVREKKEANPPPDPTPSDVKPAIPPTQPAAVPVLQAAG